jgi:hypothetical protein
MTRSALIIVSAVSTLAVPSVASGQEFAGGAIGAGSKPDAVGTSELGFRVNAGRLTVRGTLRIACRRSRSSEVEGQANGPVNPDGTFRVTFTRRRLQPGGSPRFRRTVVVSGQVRGPDIVGRIEATATGGGVRGCRGASDFVARQAPALDGTPAPAPGGATLIGMNSSNGGPFAVNLRVAADGSRITQFVAGSRYTCRRLRPYHETNYSPAFRINPDGTFRYVERFRVRFTDVTDRVTVTTEGRFVNGGAIGTWQARSVSRSRRTNRIVDRCNTGRLDWSAAVV